MANKSKPAAKMDAEKVLPPRHASIGISGDVTEHEDERLNPACGDGSPSGAARGKPHGPSNSS